MKKTLIIIFLISIISCKNNQHQQVKPRLADLTESVYAAVEVIPKEAYNPQPNRSGIIKSIMVEEGDVVSKGQPLFEISVTPEVKNRVKNAELNLEESRSNYVGENNMLLNIQAEINTVKQQLSLDSLKYFRQKKLWDQNIGSKNDLENLKLKYKSSQNQLDILKQSYAQTLSKLEKTYLRNVSQNKSEKSQLKDFVVKSSISGVVYTIKKEVGEFISSQSEFAEIGSKDQFILEMAVDEMDIMKIEVGDTAIIVLDAFPDRVFTSLVTKISPKKDARSQTFATEGKFISPPEKLYNGLVGEANIVVGRRKKAIVIPSEYLISDNKVLTPDGEIPVKVGIKTLEYVEILAGIDTTTILQKETE